jgi:hypothetical protein
MTPEEQTEAYKACGWIILVTALVLLFQARAQGSEKLWMMHYDPTGIAIPREEMIWMLNDAAHGWSLRTTHRVVPWIRSFEQPTRDGTIWVRNATFLDMIMDGAPTQSTIAYTIQYLTDDVVVRSVIKVNVSRFNALSRECQLYVLTHEIGHAIGIMGHSDNPADVMYASAERGCQHTITANDALLAGGGGDLCTAELSPHGYVYLPAAHGYGVRLDPVASGLIYRVGRTHQTGGHCSMDDMTIGRISSVRHKYVDVKLAPYGYDYLVIGGSVQ